MSKSIGRVGAIRIGVSGEGVVIEHGVGEFTIRDATDARHIAQLLNGAADEVERMRAERAELADLSGNPRFDRGG